MSVHTIHDLKQMQALPLSIKIRMTEQRIRDWVNEYGREGVYVSFSGGKDSTVLLDIVRNRLGYTDVPAVFVDTGLEYPEIREFVKTFDNVVWLKPEMNFKQVIQKYGYPFIGKEVADTIYYARRYYRQLRNNEIDENRKANPPTRVQQLLGVLPHKEKGKETNEYSKMYDRSKYAFLLEAPFEIAPQCCNVMKKTPVKKYGKLSHRYPMTGTMAEESRKRTQAWLRTGCNVFDAKVPESHPMAFWTEQDVLHYIRDFKLPICSVYGDIVPDYNDADLGRQLDMSDLGLIPDDRKLKTTGCERTGCMFCGFGCHLEKGEGRFERMKKTHPKQYDYIMRPADQGGLNYKEVIDWINENGNTNIKY